MEIEIEDKKENKLLERMEIKFRLTHEGETPPRKRVKEKIAEKIGGKDKIIIIDWIKPAYGAPEASGYAKIYSSKEIAEKIEAKYILQRNLGGKKPEEKPKEQPQEKPKEEPKEKPKEQSQEKPKKKPEEKQKEEAK